MILTCPACDTKYVVKDNAIPPEGRKVRCASCKHSWHQFPDAASIDNAEGLNDAVTSEPEVVRVPSVGGPTATPHASKADGQEMGPDSEDRIDYGNRDEFEEDDSESSAGTASLSASMVGMRKRFAGLIDADGSVVPDTGAVADLSAEGDDETAATSGAFDDGIGETYSGATDGEAGPGTTEPVEDFDVMTPMKSSTVDEYDEAIGYLEPPSRPRSRRRLPWVFGAVALLGGLVLAYWFLAPSDWKQRTGFSSATESPLKLMITASDRQKLESGNELVSISGRVINPTDRELGVPSIKALLRNKQTKAIVHEWTIAPPAQVLAPRSSVAFNSAEVDVPAGGDELTVSIGS